MSICIENKGVQKAKNIKLTIYPHEFDSHSSISELGKPITHKSWTISMFLKFEFRNINRGEVQTDAAHFNVNFHDTDSEIDIFELVRKSSISYVLTCDDQPPKTGVVKIT